VVEYLPSMCKTLGSNPVVKNKYRSESVQIKANLLSGLAVSAFLKFPDRINT
jgi:hypothetical protein